MAELKYRSVNQLVYDTAGSDVKKNHKTHLHSVGLLAMDRNGP